MNENNEKPHIHDIPQAEKRPPTQEETRTQEQTKLLTTLQDMLLKKAADNQCDLISAAEAIKELSLAIKALNNRYRI